jgi:tetratricopeptide (TPR) repeat protein
LEGTIVVINQKFWCVESTFLIPVEAIQISERNYFRRHLKILSILIPVITSLLGLVAYLSVPVEKWENGDWILMVAAVLLLVIVLELVLLCALLLQFLFTQKTICLTNEKSDFKIEFWKTKRASRQIDNFLKQLKEAQARVSDSAVRPSEEVFEIKDVNHVRRLIPLTLLFCLPSLMLELPALLVLASLPTAWYLYHHWFRLLQHPKLFRQAICAYRRRNWQRALDLLKILLQDYPDYLPGLLLLAEVLVRLERFDEALRVAATIPQEYLNEKSVMYSEIWKWKRISLRRIETKTQNLED